MMTTAMLSRLMKPADIIMSVRQFSPFASVVFGDTAMTKRARYG